MKHKNLFLAAALGFGASAAFLYVFFVVPNDNSIGIIGIAFTIAVGFLIYFMQRETDKEVKHVVDRIRGITDEIKSYHDEFRNFNDRITKSSLYAIYMRLEFNLHSLANVKRQVDETKIGDKVNVLKDKIKYWNRFHDYELRKELEFVRSKISPELYRSISIAIGQLWSVVI